MWLLILGTALAHSPHDVATVLSLAPDGTVLTNDSDQLAVSEDGGNTFSYVTWFDGEPLCAMADDRWSWQVAAEGGELWRTDDGGDSWSAVPGPSELSACFEAPGSEGLRWLAGPTGLWWSAAGDPWEGAEWAPEAAPVALAPLSDGRIVVVDRAGGVLRWSPDGSVEVLEARDVLGLATEGERVLLGRHEAPPLLSEDGGDTFLPLASGPLGARVLALQGSSLWAATDTEAVWSSEDDGQDWVLYGDGLDELAVGAGGPSDGIHYFHIRPEVDRTWLSGFEGIYWRGPEDSRWIQGALDTIPRVRTVAWLPGGELLVGSYGGGVTLGLPGEADWDEVSEGIGWPWPKQIQVAPRDPDTWFVVSGSALYSTFDAGQSWDTLPVLLGEAGDAMAPAPTYPDDPRLVVAGRNAGGDAGLAWSQDDGLSWTITPFPGTCRLKPTDILWHEAQGIWMACGTDGQLAWSEDGGQTLELGPTVGAQVEALVAGDDALWLATGDGLWRLVEGELTQVALAGEGLTALALREGELWTAVTGVGIEVVDASTGSTRSLDWPGAEPVEDLVVHEDLDQIAVGLRTGAWFSRDAGETWSQATDYDRVDEELQHWFLEGWAPTSREGAMRERLHRGEAGARAELRVDGVHLRLVGESRDGATLRITIDGEAAEVEVQGALGRLWGTDLESGMHLVEIEVLEGSFGLDGAERWRWEAPTREDDDTGSVTPPGDSKSCGCGAGKATLVWMPWAILFAARRRRER